MSGFGFRRRVKLGDGTWLNVSKSGVSASKKVGPRVTVNSRGKVRVNLGGGLFWRGKL